MSFQKTQTTKNFFPYEIVFNKYKIQKKLGKGSFGTVYMAENKENGEKVAIKTEINTNKNQISLLEPEAHKLHNLKGYLGIPKLFNFAKLKDYNILAMELLGKSLNEIFSSLNKKFSLKTVCTLGIDMIKLIKYIHEKNLIHRDIKPDNFMMGINKNKNILYLIDFGLSKKYINSNGNHIEFKLGKNMTGTARYCSIYTHQGIEQSRRDDLELTKTIDFNQNDEDYFTPPALKLLFLKNKVYFYCNGRKEGYYFVDFKSDKKEFREGSRFIRIYNIINK